MALQPLDDLNAASPLSALRAGPMPTEDCYTRSNFGVPAIDPSAWRLSIAGLVGAPLQLALDDLRAMGERTEIVAMECAGNGRRLMDPPPDGAPWGLGAVSVASYTGIPLAGVLEAADPQRGVIDFVFTGADRGPADGTEIPYAFSLAAEAALGEGPLLAWGMNGDPLTPEHGAPLRLVAPGKYGMNSVKWLESITALDRFFDGHFRMKYRYFGEAGTAEASPVGPMRVRSLIVSPTDGDAVSSRCTVSGIAWSGTGSIESVVVRIDDGEWHPAEVGKAAGKYAPSPWQVDLDLPAGSVTLAARATDSAGNAQPLDSVWNANGYGNNVVHRITVDNA